MKNIHADDISCREAGVFAETRGVAQMVGVGCGVLVTRDSDCGGSLMRVPQCAR